MVTGIRFQGRLMHWLAASMALLGGLAWGAYAVAQSKDETESVEAGVVYQWTHEKRQGLENWQYYLVCDDAKAARAFTDDILDSLELYKKEAGHSVGAHLDYAFPAHLPCEQMDTVEFSPSPIQPEERFRTLGFGMVYLSGEEGGRATHRCNERPCALAPVLRQFIHVNVLGETAREGAWLRVGSKVQVKVQEQEETTQ